MAWAESAIVMDLVDQLIRVERHCECHQDQSWVTPPRDGVYSVLLR